MITSKFYISDYGCQTGDPGPDVASSLHSCGPQRHKAKRFFYMYTWIRVEIYYLNVLFIHMLQNMQSSVAIETLLSNYS